MIRIYKVRLILPACPPETNKSQEAGGKRNEKGRREATITITNTDQCVSDAGGSSPAIREALDCFHPFYPMLTVHVLFCVHVPAGVQIAWKGSQFWFG